MWGALKNVQMVGLFSDDGNRLYCRRARSNHAYLLPGKVHRFVWPLSGVVDRTSKRILSLKHRCVRG